MDDNFEVNLPSSLSSATISFPSKTKVKAVKIVALPSDWNMPNHFEYLQQLGDNWLDSLETLVLKVPSAVISSEYNYLINPSHPDFRLIKIESVQPFRFDKRLFK